MTNSCDYQTIFSGRLYGVLGWQKFDDQLARLRAAPEGWYVWDCRAGVHPQEPLTAGEFAAFLDQARAFLKKQDRSGYGLFAYADNLAAPRFFKIFDPLNMGSACSTSAKPVLPRWTISRCKPQAAPAPQPAPRKRSLLARLGLGN